MTPPWKEIYTTDTERDQTFEESIEIYEKLREWYVMHDYQPILVPLLPVELRLKFILENIK